jgi:hypothetical protein
MDRLELKRLTDAFLEDGGSITVIPEQERPDVQPRTFIRGGHGACNKQGMPQTHGHKKSMSNNID